MENNVIFAAGDTRRAAAQRLEALGIKGAAAELLLKVGARSRHQARVEQARAAAIAAAREILGANAEEMELGIVAQFLGLLDAAGVGGAMGLEGAATARHPVFSACGTGRKQARDGRAWSAAIEEATGCPSASQLSVAPRDGKLEIGTREWVPTETTPEEPVWSDAAILRSLQALSSPTTGEWKVEHQVVLNPASPTLAASLEWLAVVAAEGLRKSTGLSPMNFMGEARVPLAGFLAEASPAEWAGVYNAVKTALAANKE